jgi:Cytochrome c oxidase caa3 assembly factor (Caa3_CtaG)
MQTGTSRTSRYARWPGRWVAAAGGVLLVLCVMPLELIVRQYLFAESIQFCAFAMAIPALLVLGAPWVPPHRGRLSFGGALAVGAVFAAVCLAWRLPPVLDALARNPVLQVPELATLLLAGTGLWLQLAGSPSRAGLGRTQRAAVAALAMWSVWVIAYVLGFANHAVIHAYDLSGSGAVTDQELSAFLLWAVSGACFIPVIGVTMLGWLRDSSGPGAGSAEEADAEPGMRGVPAVRGWGRPPRSR